MPAAVSLGSFAFSVINSENSFMPREHVVSCLSKIFGSLGVFDWHLLKLSLYVLIKQVDQLC